jgi:malate permease and related proteins
MSVLDAILPVFALIALGFLLRRLGTLPEAADRPILDFAYRWAYPAFILVKMMNDPALHQPGNLFWPGFSAVLFMTASMGIGWLVAPLLGLRTRPAKAAFAVAVSIQNYGYLPVPILEHLFPTENWAGVLFVYSLGVELVMWTLGVMVMSGKFQSPLRQMANPIVGSILLGILLTYTGWDALAPKAVKGFLLMLGQTSFPLGILMFGVTLADVTRAAGWYRDWKTPLGASVLRLVLFPLGMLVFVKWISPSLAFDRVISVQVAMPAAAFPLILAKTLGGDEAVAARVIVATTLLSLVTIPLVLPWATHFLAR